MANNSEQSGIDTDAVTMSRFILEEQQKFPDSQGDLTILMNAISTACKAISSAVRRAGMAKLYGMAGETNVQGEDQKKLDVLANDLFINCLRATYKTCVLVSEENETVIEIEDHLKGNYCVTFDPLDGSSNIDCCVSIGTIFGIYKKLPESKGSLSDVMRPGKEMVCAGYALYGSATVMVFTTGQGVNCFTLDGNIGEFVLTQKAVRIKERGKIYSVNEGNSKYWDNAVKEYVDAKKNPAEGNPYSARYVGSMVADVHRTLLYGGIFMYPSDTKSPNGKLRLLYEAAPMAMIMEQAGGMATTGRERILDFKPTTIHQRVPTFLGSSKDVEDLLAAYKRLDGK